MSLLVTMAFRASADEVSASGLHLPLLRHRWLLQDISHPWLIKTVRQNMNPRILVTYLIFAIGASALAQDKPLSDKPAVEKAVKALSESLCANLLLKDLKKVESQLYLPKDDSIFPNPDAVAQRVKGEYDKLVKNRAKMPNDFVLKEVVLTKIEEQNGRWIAYVRILIKRPGDDESPELTVTWLKTINSGWKLIDL